ncbi:MAG: chemotaxis response regulator protein-glutamate methylesterase [Planctomycetes bacterium]|nr:chemotaxis response regulator protein-glutamate methylesterase [Planctomycetota bacterium]
MAKIRVLIVDDAVVIRKLLSEALASDPDIEIAGIAANGRIALAKLADLAPDIVTLDVEMPEMDGLATLTQIRKLQPKLPVVMFSTLTEAGAGTTLEALARGASDYATKPSNTGSMDKARQAVIDELVPRIKALCARKLAAPAPPRSPDRPATGPTSFVPRADAARPAASGERLLRARASYLLAIGCSTGGPNALDCVLGGLPAELGVPVVIVQHMPPMFTRLLAERLDTKCPLRVHEAQAGMRLEPNHVYIAPGDWHMLVKREGTGLSIALDQSAPENSCRPAVDVLFRSVAQVCGATTLAVVLTGMGRDGTRGCEQIHAAGGRILAQDEATSVVWGMPGFVAQSGVAEAILPLQRVPVEITRILAQSRAAGVRKG